MNSPPKVIFTDLADKYKKKIAARKRGPGLHQVAVRNFVIAKPTRNPDGAAIHVSGIHLKATETLTSPSVTTPSSASSPSSVSYATPTSSLGISDATIVTTPRSILTDRVSTHVEDNQPLISSNPVAYDKKSSDTCSQLCNVIRSVSPLSRTLAFVKEDSPLSASPRKKGRTDLTSIMDNAQIGIHRADGKKAHSTSPPKSGRRNDLTTRRSTTANETMEIEDKGHRQQSPGSNEMSKQGSRAESETPIESAGKCALIGKDILKPVVDGGENENEPLGKTRKRKKKVSTTITVKKEGSKKIAQYTAQAAICTDTSAMDFAADILSQIVAEYIKAVKVTTTRNEIMQFEKEANFLLRAFTQSKPNSGNYTSLSGRSDCRTLPPLWTDRRKECSQTKSIPETIQYDEYERKQKIIESANQQLLNLDALRRSVRSAGNDNGPRDGIEGLIKTVAERCGKRRCNSRPLNQGGEEVTADWGMVTRLRAINDMLEIFVEKSSVVTPGEIAKTCL